jgi:hypothetical protein
VEHHEPDGGQPDGYSDHKDERNAEPSKRQAYADFERLALIEQGEAMPRLQATNEPQWKWLRAKLPLPSQT